MEIKMCEVVLAGRIASELNRLEDGSVHFLLNALKDGKPLHCFAEEKTAENFLRFCEKGDEVSCEGVLEHYQFSNEKAPRLLIKVRYASYGRKKRTLR